MSTTIVSAIDIPPEIAEVAMQLGVSAELPHVLAMTQEVFPGDPWWVEIDDDPEIKNDRHLAIVVKPSIGDVDDLVKAQWRWCERLFDCCPAPLAHVFRLGTES